MRMARTLPEGLPRQREEPGNHREVLGRGLKEQRQPMEEPTHKYDALVMNGIAPSVMGAAKNEADQTSVEVGLGKVLYQQRQ